MVHQPNNAAPIANAAPASNFIRSNCGTSFPEFNTAQDAAGTAAMAKNKVSTCKVRRRTGTPKNFNLVVFQGMGYPCFARGHELAPTNEAFETKIGNLPR